jgi:hypothetical protein
MFCFTTVYVCMYIHIYMCIHGYICVCLYTGAIISSVYTCVCIYIYTCVPVYMDVYVYVCIQGRLSFKPESHFQLGSSVMVFSFNHPFIVLPSSWNFRTRSVNFELSLVLFQEKGFTTPSKKFLVLPSRGPHTRLLKGSLDCM